ncbi:MarR family transcriptional regulator [Candidatus Woesearchaeota archaeon]|nr:MarR family transcriptional regulator [Candidatus Woesearchaeota archaeon]
MNITKNKKIGLLLIGIGLLIGYIIYAFNTAMTDLIQISQCGEINCPHEAALKFQTNISLVILFIVIITGVIFLFLKEKEPINIAKKRENLEKIKTLTEEEKKIYELIKEEGSIFQSDLVEKSGLDKVKITRILDRLEGKQIIERKRRGMTNVVIIK